MFKNKMLCLKTGTLAVMAVVATVFTEISPANGGGLLGKGSPIREGLRKADPSQLVTPERVDKRTKQTPTPLGNRYRELGGTNSFLGKPVEGYPDSQEKVTPDGRGRFVHFQNGSLYWTPETGAHIILGAIKQKWAALQWERGFLRYPTTDEVPTPSNYGRFNRFQGGAIYWCPTQGARVMTTPIFDKWASLGYDGSNLRFPTSDTMACPDNVEKVTNFEHGAIYWSPSSGAHVLEGVLWANYSNNRAYQAALGYPTSDTVKVGNRYSCLFERGSMSWAPGEVLKINKN